MKSNSSKLKVGFYDSKTHRMVSVEPWKQSIHEARFMSFSLTSLYSSGLHSLPSPVWCVWSKTQDASIFFLDEKPITDEAVLDSILALMV
jgi:hypothetical protein